MSLPYSLNYSSQKPVGIQNKVLKTRFKPANWFQDLQGNDLVKFEIKCPGFWDPYSCHIQMEVEFGENDQDPTVYQIDSSAQSFISEFTIHSGNTELERIQEYDTLACLLNDLSYDQIGRSYKSHEGLSGENLQVSNTNLQNIGIVNDVNIDTTGYIKSSKFVGYPLFNKQNVTHQHNEVLHLQDYDVGKESFISYPITDYSGLAIHNRSRRDFHAPDTSLTLGPIGNPVLQMQHQMKGPVVGKDHSATAETQKALPTVIERADKVFMENHYAKHHLSDLETFKKNYNSTVVYGQETMYSGPKPEFSLPEIQNKYLSAGTLEDQFCRQIELPHMLYGTYNQRNIDTDPNIISNFKSLKYQKQSMKKYNIPFLSSILGTLVPQDCYKYIPVFAFDPLTIEFRINPYAIFTGGYLNDQWTNVTQIDSKNQPKQHVKGNADFNSTTDNAFTKNMTTQPLRNFKIKRFEIVVDVIQFQESITNQVKQQINTSGIMFHSIGYYLGPQWYLENTSKVLGNYQINLGFESLKNLLIIFLSNDYVQYSYCRKQFRLSRNLTALQMKYGLEYIPQKKLEGQAGTPFQTNSLLQDDNWEFIEANIQTFGLLNDTNARSIINQYNFAINQRQYNVHNKGPFMKISNYPGGDHMEIDNVDTAVGLPLVHENRYVGRGFYTIQCEGYNIGNKYIAGLNTMNNRPFDIIIENKSSEGVDPDRECEARMLVFCQYDFILKLTGNGIEMLGRI